MIRHFIWEEGKGGSKVHLVNWDTITSRKEVDGLGLKRLHEMNVAFMAKVGWCLLTEPNSLWARVVFGKYIRGIPSLSKFIPKKGSSNIWKGITKATPTLDKGLIIRVHNGQGTLF